MRTTVDLSDELFRRAKAEAALRGKKFRDLVEEGLIRVLEQPNGSTSKKRATLYDLMEEVCGVGSSGLRDLASNPKHMKGFGRDRKRHR